MGKSIRRPDHRHSVILASASPRRAELLRSAGIHVDIRPCHKPEPVHKPASVDVELWPVCLAHYKAAAVFQALRNTNAGRSRHTVIGADTIVELGGRIINKASNASRARAILRMLSGRTHRVITGVAVITSEQTHLISATATCRMRRLSSTVLEQYIAGGLWRGKAGAYGIQDHSDPLVELISGDMTTVMGLPMPPLLELLHHVGVLMR